MASTLSAYVTNEQTSHLGIPRVIHLFRPCFAITMPTLSALINPFTHRLVLASSTLARLQLVKIPSADLHVAVILIQALRERHGLVTTAVRAS
jgi:hypothetical protein